MQGVLINLARRHPKDFFARSMLSGAIAAWLKITVWCAVVLLTLAMSHGQAAGTPDPASIEFGDSLSKTSLYSRERDRQIARERQESFRLRIAVPDADGEIAVEDLAASQPAKRSKRTTAAQASVASPGAFQYVLFLVVFLLLAVILVIRRLAPELLPTLNQNFNPVARVPMRPANSPARPRPEEEGVTAFFMAFQAGPSSASHTTALVARGPEVARPGEAGRHSMPAEHLGAVTAFQARAAKLLPTQRSILQEINRASDEAGRHKMLSALRWEMHIMKGETGLPPLLPVWQVAAALEGLLKQLTDKPGNVTYSTLRTVAGGVDLLNDLCGSVLNLSGLTVHPIKLLVVDNDSISRNAIARALMRAFNPPDLAEDAEAALALATGQAYDVIFLDGKMSDMDGCEFCLRIHETVPNRTASVVFVTDQSDFDVRAASTLSGSTDLIGKPFLTFEITLKALTFALRGRLEKIQCAMS